MVKNKKTIAEVKKPSARFLTLYH